MDRIPLDQEVQQMGWRAEVAESDEQSSKRFRIECAVKRVSLDDFEQSSAAKKRCLATAIARLLEHNVRVRALLDVRLRKSAHKEWNTRIFEALKRIFG